MVFPACVLKLEDTCMSIKPIFFEKTNFPYEKIREIIVYKKGFFPTYRKANFLMFKETYILFFSPAINSYGVSFVNEQNKEEFFRLLLLSHRKFLRKMTETNVPIRVREKPSDMEFRI